MKNFTKILAIVIVGLAFSASAFSQASSSATAVIITPISISNTSGLNFGAIIPSSSAGSVILATDGSTTLSNVTLHSSATPAAALFAVTGSPNLTYTVAIAPASVNISNGSTTMSVGSFVSNPAVGVGTGLLDGTGNQPLRVGATLTVGANQASGTYTNATAFTVTVNYN